MANSAPHLAGPLTLMASLIVSACSSPADVTLSCPNLQVGEACSAQSHGGHIFWKTGTAKANEEYALIVMSDVDPQRQSDLTHSFTLKSTEMSAPLSSKEANDIQTVRAAQGAPGGYFFGNLQSPIPAPNANSNFFNQNITTVYVPNPLDYTTQKDGEYIPVYVQPPTAERLKGQLINFETFSTVSPYFRLIYDPSIPIPGYFITFELKMNQLQTCLTRVVQDTINLLGAPLDTDGQAEIKIAVSKFTGQMGPNTQGIFSQIDRFSHYNGQILQDTNHSEILYISDPSNPSVSCSTAGAHELQHLINFDRKVLSRIPENKRHDMSEMNRRGLTGELLGLNEAFSHVVEELSGEKQEVAKHIYSFWTHPNLTSFDPRTTTTNVAGNVKSRGLNTLLLYYVIARAGGQLHLSDLKTRQALSTLINSPDTGYENLATYLGLSRAKLFEGFFGHLLMAQFNFSKAQTFVPSYQTGIDSLGFQTTRGIYIMDRARPLNEITYTWPTVHPYQFDLPTLGISEFINFPAGGVIFRRFNVPSTLKSSSQVDLGAGGKNFSAYVVRIR